MDVARPRRSAANHPWRPSPTAWWALAAAGILVVVSVMLYVMGLHAAHPTVTLVRGTRAAGAPRRLVVFVKGGSSDMRTYRPLLDRLLAEPELAGSDLLLYDHHVVRLTTSRAEEIALRLRAEIDAQWISAGAYDDVVLAGHSMGSLFLRRAYLLAAGGDPREPETAPWASAVSRIVLLAGIGRGVDAELRGGWAPVLRAGRYVPFIRQSIMYDVLRGSDFVTNVRVGWIRHMAELARRADTTRPPVVVQLVGTEDDVLQRGDNIDLLQLPTAFHIDVPGARHRTLHRLELTQDPALAYRLFREAFVATVPAHAAPRYVPSLAPSHVVFLLHGLRGSRDSWIADLARRIRQRSTDIDVVESSYGRLSLVAFVLPSVRRYELRWLQDQYTEYLARHPNATFDVIAHSNGTYLVGESLSRVPSMQFRRIALLGSVLPTEYPWRDRHELGQVQDLRIDRAADDAIAAVLCTAMRGIGMTDVGPSGWRGFDEAGTFETDVGWWMGGHKAALAPANLESLAEFVASDRAASGPVSLRGEPEPTLRWLSRLAPWIARVVVLLLAVSTWTLLRPREVRTASRLYLALAAVAIAAIVLDVL
jgi:hypothetical protein